MPDEGPCSRRYRNFSFLIHYDVSLNIIVIKTSQDDFLLKTDGNTEGKKKEGLTFETVIDVVEVTANSHPAQR